MTLLATGYLAVDAGGTYLKSAVFNTAGEIIQGSEKSFSSFSSGSKDQILKAFNNLVSRALEFMRERDLKLEGIGIAFPGPFDIVRAVPLMEHKFQGIYGLDLRKVFFAFPGVPSDIPIEFVHDANAVLSGEIWKGNAWGHKNAAVVTLGTGLGFAISENGKVLTNELGGPYLSIFKRPFKDGILEDYTAKSGIIRRYQDLSGNENVDGIEVSDLGELANHGDEPSIQTFHEVGQILAQSLRGILIEREIDCLLFSGQISRSFHHLEPSLKEGLAGVDCLKILSAVKSIDHAALQGALRCILK